MLAMRLVRLIETHADRLSHSLTRRLENDPHCAELKKVPREELEARSYEIFSHLTDWLLYKTEHDLERPALRIREQMQPVEHRRAELMEARVRQLHLGFHPDRPNDGQMRRRGDQVLEQCRLSDAGLAPHDQRPAFATADSRDEIVKKGAFG